MLRQPWFRDGCKLLHTVANRRDALQFTAVSRSDYIRDEIAAETENTYGQHSSTQQSNFADVGDSEKSCAHPSHFDSGKPLRGSWRTSTDLRGPL